MFAHTVIASRRIASTAQWNDYSLQHVRHVGAGGATAARPGLRSAALGGHFAQPGVCSELLVPRVSQQLPLLQFLNQLRDVIDRKHRWTARTVPES